MTRSAMSPHPRKGSAKSPSRRHSTGTEQQPLSTGRPALHPAGVVAMAVQGMAMEVPSTSASDLLDKVGSRGAISSSVNSLSSRGASRDVDGLTGTSSQVSSHEEVGRSDDQVPASAVLTDEQHLPEYSELLVALADVTRQVQELSETLELHRRDSQTALESLRGDVLYTAERTRENTKNEVMQLAERINAVSHLLAKERSVREASTAGVEKQIRGFCEKFEDNYRQDIVKLGDRLEQKEASENGISSIVLSRLGDLDERCSSLESRVLDKKLASFANLGDPWTSREQTDSDELQNRVASMEAMARSLRERSRERKALEPNMYSDLLELSQRAAPTVVSSPSMSARVLPAPRIMVSRSQSAERGPSLQNSPPTSVSAPPGSAVASVSAPSSNVGSAVVSVSASTGALPSSVKMMAAQSPLHRPQEMGLVHSPSVPLRLASVQLQSLAEAPVEAVTCNTMRQSSSATSLSVPDGVKAMDLENSPPIPEEGDRNAPLRVLLSQGLTRVVSPAPTHRSMSPPETHRNVLGVTMSASNHRVHPQMRQMPRSSGLSMSSSLQALPSARIHNSSTTAAKQPTLTV